MSKKLVEIKAKVLRKNDELADELRRKFRRQNVFAVNLVSSPGSGKTAFLQEVLRKLGQGKARALVGDLATENDAARLSRSGAEVRQITTGTTCHLESEMITRSIEDWDLNEFEYLFIENVGNLVCPASYDLGEALRVVLISVTESEDKPLKYPTIFSAADCAIITKTDIAEAVGFDRKLAHANIDVVHPGLPVFELSARTGWGMDEWIEWLEANRAALVNHNAAFAGNATT
ncbi:MAG: hydrogenase nickel incorporation protein HypB [Pyrinomonadaceae bacterium]